MKVPMSWFSDYTDISGISAKEYNEEIRTDAAEECFKKPWLW